MNAPAVSTIRPDYVPHARAERLIAVGRFVLVSSSLAAETPASSPASPIE